MPNFPQFVAVCESNMIEYQIDYDNFKTNLIEGERAADTEGRNDWQVHQDGNVKMSEKGHPCSERLLVYLPKRRRIKEVPAML